MSVVVPNTGAPGEPRPASRRVGPLGPPPRRRSATGVQPHPGYGAAQDGPPPRGPWDGPDGGDPDRDTGSTGYDVGSGNGTGNGSANGYGGDGYRSGNGQTYDGTGGYGRANGYDGGYDSGYDSGYDGGYRGAGGYGTGPGNGVGISGLDGGRVNGGGSGPAGYDDGSGFGRPFLPPGPRSGANGHDSAEGANGYRGAPVVGRPPVAAYRSGGGPAGAPVVPPGDRRIGGTPGRRTIRPIDTSIDAPTEIVRRDARAYAPEGARRGAVPLRDRPSRELPLRDRPPAPSRARALQESPGRVDRRVRVPDPGPDTQYDLAEPSALERRDRPTGPPGKGGRRHHRAGSRPASDFTGGAPSRGAKRGRRRRGTFWRELPMLMVVALVLTFLIQTFLARVYEIPSGSMETTLHGCTGCTNDRVLVDKLSYHFGDPSPGDVIVFAGPPSWQDEDFQSKKAGNLFVRAFQSVGSLIGLAPPDEKDLIKRVIAVGGQTVQCCDSKNRLMVDGKPSVEPYIYYLPEAGPPSQQEFGPVKIPQGQLWVMGDSRNNSADSRVPGHGPIPIANVIGKARFVVLPFSRAQPIHAINGQSGTAPPTAR